ncbi:MAG: CidA/LrgA family protein [Oscillospiraceae bacterium]|nr:CidA/LrgA family protein [Oscillospiraceae bacterium]
MFTHLQQCLVLFGVCLAGAVISELLPIAVPGSVTGMVLLVVLMLCGVIQHRHIGDVAGFLQKNMGFFFVPMCVPVLQQLDVLRQYGLVILGICVVSTCITFAVTGLTVRLLQKLMNQKEGAK